MTSSSVQMNRGINLDILEALMDQGAAEDKRSVKNRIAIHNEKAMLLIQERLHHLEKQKKNQWRGALFGFFVSLAGQGAQFLDLLVPALGTGISKAMELLHPINPFSQKAVSAQLDSEKIQGAIQQEESQAAKTQDYLGRLEDHEARMESRLAVAQENLQQTQEAAVRI